MLCFNFLCSGGQAATVIDRGYQYTERFNLRRAMGQDARSSTRTAWISLITLSNGFSTAGVKYNDPTVPWDTASLVTGMHRK